MWTRIGLATARRQLRVGGVPLIRCVAICRPAVRHSGAIFRRAFTGSRIRGLAAAADKAKKTKTTTRKATKTAAKPRSAAKAKKAKAKKPKKTAAKKAAPKKKVKKELTVEEKRRIQIAALKKAALVGADPKTKPASARHVYMSEIEDWTPEKFTERLKNFKNLSASEQERLASIAAANKLENAAALKAFVLARTPVEISDINRARRHLHRLKVYTPRKLPVLKDERSPKRPISPFILFAAKYLTSNTHPAETAKEAGVKWKAMSAAERQPYIDNYAVDVTRFKQEYKAVFGQEPGYKQ